MSAYTTFKHHNFLNTAATQILLTSLKNLKPQQLNLFTPLWMKISVYGSAGHFVPTLCLCSVLTCIICNSLNTAASQTLLASRESLRPEHFGVSFTFGQCSIVKVALANNSHQKCYIHFCSSLHNWGMIHFIHFCSINNSLNTATPQNLVALLESLRLKQLGISFSLGQYHISKAGLPNNLCKSNTSVQYSRQNGQRCHIHEFSFKVE